MENFTVSHERFVNNNSTNVTVTQRSPMDEYCTFFPPSLCFHWCTWMPPNSTTMSDQYPRQKSGGYYHGPYNNTPPKVNNNRKKEVANMLLQGVLNDGEEERVELTREFVNDEEYEEELLEEYDYEILSGHEFIRREETRLKKLLDALPTYYRLTDAFEADTNQVLKCYCPACPPHKCEFDNPTMMMDHLREKSRKKRGWYEKYWEYDQSHKLVLAYIEELFPKYKRG